MAAGAQNNRPGDASKDVLVIDHSVDSLGEH